MKKDPAWAGRIYVGGGFLRSVVTGEPINDVDVFVGTKSEANLLAKRLADRGDEPSHSIYVSDNAMTIRGLGAAVQVIHRWLFAKGEDVADSFDFTICCAVFWYGTTVQRDALGNETVVKGWQSYCDDNFYPDLAAKRLVYRSPERNEDAGGSMLRVLKYYQKGYRIPLDSMGKVIARLMSGVTADGIECMMKRFSCSEEQATARVITGLLREVDPAIDPNHIAHLPSDEDNETEIQ